MSFTILDEGRAVVVPATVDGGRVRIPADAVHTALGWELHDGQLCSDTMCVPVPDTAALADERGIDLAALAAALDRPLALDVAESAAYLGVSAHERAQALSSLDAPDFTLPDLAGRLHSLSEHRGRKVLLVAYASW
jgi:hypothetical protein